MSQANKDMNRVLLASAKGDWEEARALASGLVERDGENFAVRFCFGRALNHC